MNGDSYRWLEWSEPSIPRFTIEVIEPPEERQQRGGASAVPFGFARVLTEDEGQAKP